MSEEKKENISNTEENSEQADAVKEKENENSYARPLYGKTLEERVYNWLHEVPNQSSISVVFCNSWLKAVTTSLIWKNTFSSFLLYLTDSMFLGSSFINDNVLNCLML